MLTPSCATKLSVLHTEYVAGGGQTEFPICTGGAAASEGVYVVSTFQKSREGKSSPRGAKVYTTY